MTVASPKPRVLVIEDEFLIAEMIMSELEACGCEPLGPLGNLDEALAGSLSVAPDAVILDLILRDREAYSVAELLTERGVRFGFLTGAERSAMKEPWTMLPRLEKPFTSEDFRKFVRELLEDGRQP